jgi:hypothetical protein
MTMHLLPAYINTNGNTKRKKTPQQARAEAEHEKWLKKNGVHSEQLADRVKPKSKKLKLNLVQDRGGPSCTNGFAPGGAKRSVFDSEWQRRYDDPAMAERERVALKAAQEKKSRVMPIFNKGGLQYAGNLKMTELGKRRP